jgi:hypothetical protein
MGLDLFTPACHFTPHKCLLCAEAATYAPLDLTSTNRELMGAYEEKDGLNRLGVRSSNRFGRPLRRRRRLELFNDLHLELRNRAYGLCSFMHNCLFDFGLELFKGRSEVRGLMQCRWRRQVSECCENYTPRRSSPTQQLYSKHLRDLMGFALGIEESLVTDNLPSCKHLI